MRSTVRRLAPVIVAALVWPMAAPAVLAIENDSFGLTPHPERVGNEDRISFSIPVEPGATFEDAMRIYNRTDEPLSLVIYAADADTAEDETITVGVRTDRPQGIASWIDLARTQVDLPAREEAVVNFSIEIRSPEPVPSLGAIVVENTTAGLASNATERLHLRVHSLPPNTPTTSTRVRPLVLQSPWLALAVAGLVLTIVLIVIGAMRARRPKDVVLPAGHMDEEEEPDDAGTTDSSRPVIRRLGQADEDDDEGLDQDEEDGDEREGDSQAVEGAEKHEPTTTRLRRAAEHLGRRSADSGKRSGNRDARPLLDDELLSEVSPEEAGRSEESTRVLRPLSADDTAAKDGRSSKPVPAKQKAAPSSKSGKSGAGRRRKPVTRSSSAAQGSRTSRKTSARKKTAKSKTQDFIPLSDL